MPHVSVHVGTVKHTCILAPLTDSPSLELVDSGRGAASQLLALLRRCASIGVISIQKDCNNAVSNNTSITKHSERALLHPV